MKVTEQMTPLSLRDDKTGKIYRWQLYRNPGPYTLVVTVSDQPQELIPVIVVDERIDASVSFCVDGRPGDTVLGGPRFFENVLTLDRGQTRLTLGNVVSNFLQRELLSKSTGLVHSAIQFTTNCSILVGEDKWANVDELALKYSIEKAGWVKVFPTDQLKHELLQSNSVALTTSSIKADATWSRVTNVDAFIRSTTGMLVVCENQLEWNSNIAFNVGFRSTSVTEKKPIQK